MATWDIWLFVIGRRTLTSDLRGKWRQNACVCVCACVRACMCDGGRVKIGRQRRLRHHSVDCLTPILFRRSLKYLSFVFHLPLKSYLSALFQLEWGVEAEKQDFWDIGPPEQCLVMALTWLNQT
jgi:hypothetical protein